MNQGDGKAAGQLVLDLLAVVTEEYVDARIVSMAVVMVVETPDGEMHTVTLSDTPPRDSG